MLAKDPRSLCFAPLAEIYRKLGLLDDAINLAKQGCEIHTDYVGGYMALGRAYFEKGMKAESKKALEKVVMAMPENLLAHKLLSQICIESGEIAAAESSLRTILSLNSSDTEARLILDSLAGTASQKTLSNEQETSTATLKGEIAAVRTGATLPLVEDETVLEDLEIIEELSEVVSCHEDDNQALHYEIEESISPSQENISARDKDPLKTVTLAELYVSQGFIERAIDIYQELVDILPDNAELKERLAVLRESEEKAAIVTFEDDSETIPSSISVKDESVIGGVPMGEDAEIPSAYTRGGVLDTLEEWLENIKRRRQCHSERR